MAIAMVAGTGASVSLGSVVGTNVTVSAADTLTEGDYEYQINDLGTVTIVKYIGADTEVVIPDTIADTTVEVIGNNAFRESKITSVTFPATLKEIGEGAFYRCYYLRDVTFPSGLKKIGNSAFESCRLFTRVDLPAGLTTLGSSAFRYCNAVTSVTLSEVMTTVPNSAFQETNIAEVTIPDVVETIDSYAFYNCRNLQKVNFGENSALTRINYQAFYECTALTAFNAPDTLQGIDGYAFYNCRSLATLTFSNALKYISYNAFQNCSSLKNLTFPADAVIDYISSNSFNGCISLETVRTGGVKYIDDSAFKNCTSLRTVYFSDSLERVDNESFYNTPSLVNFYNVPQKRMYLEDHAFDASGWMDRQPDGVVYFGGTSYATKGAVTNVTIKDGTKWIDNRTFKNSSGLKSITIPASVTDSIDFRDIFDACGNTLTAINFDENHEKYQSINGVVYSKDGKQLIYCPRAKSGTITVPDEVEQLNSYALRGCNKITTVKLGLNTRYIDSYDFVEMAGLTTITAPSSNIYFTSLNGILYNKTKTYLYAFPNAKTGVYTMPDTLESTYYYAFTNATGVTKINVPSTMKEMYPGYWSNNTALTAINVDENNQWYTSVGGVLYNKEKTRLYLVPDAKVGDVTIPDTVTHIDGQYTFNNCTGIQKLTIPAATVNIGDNYFDNCLSITEFVVDPDNTRVQSVNGCLMNLEKDYVYAIPKGAATVTLPDNIVSQGRIRDNALINCPNLVTLNLSDNFNDFSCYYMLANCPKLTAVNVSENNSDYTTVDGVLYNKAKTRILYVPGGKTGAYTAPATVNAVYDRAFKDATKLTSITFPKNFTSTFDLGYTFYNCASLTSLNFAGSDTSYVTVSGAVLNKDKTKLYYVPNGKTGTYTVPATVTSIDSRAFLNCSKLTGIVLPENLKEISFDTSGMDSLVSLTIPAGVTSISSNFYDKFPNLVISGYEGTEAEWYSNYHDVKFNKLARTITLNKTSVETAAGRTVNLTATLDIDRVSDSTITWKSENTKVATVAADGTVTAVAAGVTRVSAATADGKTAYCNILVNAPLENLSMLSSESVLTGESVTLTGAASGGVRNYKYAMYARKLGAANWTTISGFTTNAAASFTPAEAGTYELCIKVKDNNSVVENKYFTLKASSALNNTSTVSEDMITLGETLVLFGSAEGGAGSIAYQYQYKEYNDNDWTTISDYSANTVAIFKPTAAGSYTFRVNAKDSRDNVVGKEVAVTVSGTLANTSTLSADTVMAGKSITVTGSATGGKGGYTYAYYYKQFSQKNWAKIADFSASTTAVVTPRSTGAYQVCVKVKDQSGTVVSQYFNLTVNDKLKNTTVLSDDDIVYGENITVKASAQGGTGGYTYAVFYKKTTDTKWTTKQTFSTNATVTVTPMKAAKYDICVKAKDSSGQEDKLYFVVNVSAFGKADEPLVNNATIDAQNNRVSLGDSITVKAAANGGASSEYTYAILYKKSTDTNWVVKQKYGINTTAVITPAKEAVYQICVKAKDAKGTIAKKYFTVTAASGVRNTSTISATEITLGESVTVNASGTNGTTPYTYSVQYKKTTDTKWTTAQAMGANAAITITPAKKTTYQICVKVQDGDGNISPKYFDVVVN